MGIIIWIIVFVIVVVIIAGASNNGTTAQNLDENKKEDIYQLFRINAETKDVVFVLPWTKNEIEIDEDTLGKIAYVFHKHEIFKDEKLKENKVKKLNGEAKSKIYKKNWKLNMELSKNDVKDWLKNFINFKTGEIDNKPLDFDNEALENELNPNNSNYDK